MKHINFLLSALLVTYSSCSSAGPAWRGEGKIAEILVNYHNAGFVVRFDQNVSLNGCVSPNEVIINRSVLGYNELYSGLLAAFAAGKTVNLYVTGSCENSRNTATAFSIKN